VGGSSKKVTVGYRYYLGVHMILCHGPIDRLLKVLVDGKAAWQGSAAGGRISISAESLFGGESREGGVGGAVDIEMGGSSQEVNDYLASRLGSNIPAFRGVVGAVLRQCYLGINPYLKKWAFVAQRVNTRQNGLEQWYNSKAKIAAPDVVIVSASSGGWEYVQLPEEANPGIDNLIPPTSGWTAGVSPFGGGTWTWPGQPARNTNWDQGTVLWMRRTVTVQPGSAIVARVRAENGCVLLIDNSFLGAANQANQQLLSGEVLDFSLPPGTYTLYVKAYDEVPTQGDVYVSVEIVSLAHADMNPAHIVRECLTDPDWGMGYQDADIDDVSFALAADKLHEEQFGLSLLWDRQTPIEDFVKEVIRHVQASLYVDRATGKFALKLIRGDYDAGALLVLDESSVEKVDNFSRPSFGDMVNSVTVNYYDRGSYKTASISAQDTALIQMQGAVIGTTIQYPGCTDGALAARMAARDLHILSTPLLSCTVYANRKAASLNVGDPFVLDWPDYLAEPTVMRVVGLALGDGRSNKVKITCTEDVFSLPESASVQPEVPDWEDPSTAPAAADHRAVVEAPYYELVQRMGQTTADEQLAANPDIGYLLASAAAPSGAINARLAVNAGAGYEEGNDTPVDFCPSAFLVDAMNPGDTIAAIHGAASLSAVTIGSHAQIGDELVKVVALSDSSITVGRGVLDTVPAAHAAGSAVLFWDAFADSDGVEYAAGETIGAKLLTVSGAGALLLAQAPEDTLTFGHRAMRPYPPGKLLINAVAYPVALYGDSALTVSWAHRDRLQQTAGELQDTTVGNIGPEAGTTYNIRLYGEAGTLLRSVSMPGTSYAYTTTDEKADSLIPDNGAFDTLWGSVVLAMHMDGVNDGTAFTDVKGKAVTRSGNVVTKTAVKKFGSASAYFDGNNDYLSVASHADLGFGTGDFTIEMQVHKAGNSVVSTGTSILLDMRTAEPSVAIEMHLRRSDFADPNKLEVYINGATRIMSSTAFGASFKHIALERKAGVTKLFVDGVQEGSSYTDANDYGASAPVVLGGRFAAVSGDFRSHNGYLDEVRITKGIARYDGSNFTPPTAEFPESATGTYRLNGRLRVELESERGGLTSYQAHDYTVLRAGYGFNYGELYGGV